MVPQKVSKRRTSKMWLAVNTCLAWIAIFYALYTQQGAVVVAAMVGLIGNYSAYVLVGHWDLKQVLQTNGFPQAPSPPPMNISQYEGLV
jgi:xanthine/uracil permease